MQQVQNPITPHDLTSMPTRVMVVGYKYKVDFGPSVIPRIHLVDKQRRCSCEQSEQSPGDRPCPAIEAVAEYLRSGGPRAPNPMPACPICGAETIRDLKWDGKYTHEIGWRCAVGGLAHFLQAKAERIRQRQMQSEAQRRESTAVSEHESEAGR